LTKRSSRKAGEEMITDICPSRRVTVSKQKEHQVLGRMGTQDHTMHVISKLARDKKKKKILERKGERGIEREREREREREKARMVYYFLTCPPL
jgi:hypothetical protein